MTPDELAAAFGERFSDAVSADTSYGQLTVDVPVESWVDAVLFARDSLGCTYFDWVSAVDELESGFAVVVHLWSVEQRHHVLVRTHVPRSAPWLPSLVSVFAGANWHERETYEMFGVIFEDHPGLVPLLLPEGFEGHPLRKEFVLAARAAKPWPGAKEPGESDAHAGAPSRRRTLPPGVPDPATWGPRPPAGDEDPRPADGGEPA